MLDLEEKLIRMCKDEEFDLANAGLIASGIRDKGGLDFYLDKFNGLVLSIAADSRVSSAETDVKKAQAVFDWLWESKPKRDDSASRLTDALDNQLSNREQVGDCMGLTLLYNSICQRLGISMKAVWTVRHIYSAMDTEKGIIPVENTMRYGFGNGLGVGIVIGNQQLIQRFLLRQAFDYKEAKDHKQAFSLTEIALRINPETAVGSSLTDLAKELGDLGIAIKSYRQILREHPDSYEVMENLAQALEQRHKKGDSSIAIGLYRGAIKLREQKDNSSAFDFYRLGYLYIKVKKYKEASDSLRRAVELEPQNDFYHQLLGDSLKARKIYPEAIAAYQKSLELDPDGHLAKLGLSEAKFGFTVQRLFTFVNPHYHLRKIIAYLSQSD